MEVPMKHKTTIKDVAREAGVSVATVSYVINNRTDLRISDATRKKVMQVVNLLDYHPNQAAKALATNQRNLLAITCSKDSSPFQKAQHFSVITRLSGKLKDRGYDLMLLPENYTKNCDSADAIICYDLSADIFHMLGDNNFAPLIALDCMIGDPLFFEINTDICKLSETADNYFHGQPYTYITFRSQNSEKNRFLLEHFPNIVFMDGIDRLYEVNHAADTNILVTDDTLLGLLSPDRNILSVPSANDSKVDALLLCVENALKRIQIQDHQIFV